MSHKFKGFKKAKLPYHVMLGLSAVAMAAGSVPGVALAQTDSDSDDDDDNMLEEVIVTGVRGSLMSSQDLKQNSDVFVDAVTADDIGALPDRSVNEVLQRIPGVAITRFAGVNDPDHFSVEGSGTIIRGLTFVRSELNGRDVFTADSGQALGFNTVSPELMQSVQVFKNQSADMIEGGIGGTVNLITRKPFDSDEQTFAFSVEANYSDLAEEWTPGASALWSSRWDLDSGGEFGLLFSVAYSDLKSRADGTLVADWLDRDGSGQYVPSGGGVRIQEYDRERIGYSGAAQWANADGSMEATFEFFNSSYENAWGEHAIEPSIDDSPGIIPRAGTEFTFGDNGLFQSGIISENSGWRSSNADIPLTGVRQLALRRENNNQSETQDYSFNFKWTPGDQWSTNFDFQHVESEVDVTDYTVHNAFYADVFVDTTTEVPQVTYIIPEGQPEDYFTTASNSNYYNRSIMDHLEDSDGEENAFRADAEFDFSGDSWAKSVRFGARYAEREQTVRYSTYNWGNVSAVWNEPFMNANAPAGTWAPFNFDNYQRGDNPVNTPINFYAGDLSPEALTALAAQSPVASWVSLANRNGVVPGTPYLPGEINEATQETFATYARFDFGWDDLGNGWGLDGNIGVRYVSTDQAADGGIVYPDYDQWLGGETLEERCTANAPGSSLPGFCDLPADQQAAYAVWADGSSTLINDSYDYDNWLPSLNLRLGKEAHQFRLGLSQSIFRPDFGLLKSNFNINFGQDDPITGEFLGPDASTAQVRLDPIKSNNIDLSWEWYFADVGSLTISAFYKDLEDYHVPSTIERPFENNGETFDVLVTGVGNAEDAGEVTGFEIGYQQVYDMLPGFMQYFGIQANYTYIDSEGVPNIGVKSDEPTGIGSAPNFDVSGLMLPGLSEDTINFTLFWETEKISTRLAWNYRSEFVLTTRDVIFPFTPIVHADTSQLDGSFFYRIGDRFQVGLQAVNLLDEITETQAVYRDDLSQAPRSFFRNDRRFALIFRGSF